MAARTPSYWVANNPNSLVTDAEAQKLEELSATSVSIGQLNAGIGAIRVASFGYSLADTTGGTTAYADNDCLVELGTLDTSTANSGMQTPTKIMIRAVHLNETVAMGSALSGEILVSATSGL